MGTLLLETILGLSLLLGTLVCAITTLQHLTHLQTKQQTFQTATLNAQNQLILSSTTTPGPAHTIKTIAVDQTHVLEIIQ